MVVCGGGGGGGVEVVVVALMVKVGGFLKWGLHFGKRVVVRVVGVGR